MCQEVSELGLNMVTHPVVAGRRTKNKTAEVKKS